MADQVLYSGVACITDLMVKEGLINLDFADVRAVMREMGKAMMGTGEASGEKRALRAAEAAISNPLIDDVSMKGARGLLISITGGRDLTLYEVDEAATRIREEVDQEANIIVGATFDEGLEGIIRVSVVATGIDHIVARPMSHPESRPAEATLRPRADVQRLERPDAPPVRPAGPPPMHAQAAGPGSAVGAIEQAAAAAIAAATHAPTAIEDVKIRPIPPKPSLFVDPPARESAPQPRETPRQFIPPQPERFQARTPRMPRIEELPIPAQNEIRAKRGELPEDHPEKRRKTLLQRIASVGLGRREEEPEAPPEVRPMLRPAPMPERAPPERMTPRPAPRQQEPVSEFAKRPPPQGLDLHGRQAPVHNSPEDDQLDIPAFLRRQAN
jgi:cell division protein FtsZ